MTEKRFWLSKTFWTNLVIPVLGYFVPGASDWIIAHPKETLFFWSAINIVLRFVTKDKVKLI